MNPIAIGTPVMRQLKTSLPLMLADFRERVRSYRFIAMLLFSIGLTYFFIPDPDTYFYANLAMGPARPAYTSAAIGSLTTLLMGEFFILFAFYLVKGNIERDRRTGVGQVIATTPVSRAAYTVGKWLANVAVLSAMVAVIFLAAVVLQLVRGEDLHLDLWAIAAPFIIVLLPALIVVAALAVLFECINLLRGGLGNVVYFGVFGLLVGLPIDFQGINLLYPSLYQACTAQFSGCAPFREIDLSGDLAGLPTFIYPGVHWSWETIAGRLLFVAAGALIALVASLPFHRFDPARAEGNVLGRLFQRAKAAVGFVTNATKAGTALQFSSSATGEEPLTANQAPSRVGEHGFLEVRSLQGSGKLRVFTQALRAELRLAFKGVPGWWWAGAGALVITGLAAPAEMGLLVALPLAWIWPLLIWSNMGTREAKHGVEPIVCSTPYPITRQLTATWLSGVFVALAMASGVILRLAFEGQWLALPPLLIGALFIPTLALAAGCWTGGGKLFEAGYLFLWYLAVITGVPMLDFMGRTPEGQAWGLPMIYAGLTGILAAAAVVGRLRVYN